MLYRVDSMLVNYNTKYNTNFMLHLKVSNENTTDSKKKL